MMSMNCNRTKGTKWINFAKKHFIDRQFVLFGVVGGINALSGLSLAFTFSMHLQANLAFAAGYAGALVIAFFLNSRFVFNSRPEFLKFMKFIVSYVPNFIIQSIVVVVVYNILKFHQLIAYVLAAAIGISFTFLLLKFFAFRSDVNERISTGRR